MTYAEALRAAPPDVRARAVAAILATLGPLRLRYCPGTPTAKQEVFLRLTGDEAFYGGAAGPGKSWAMLAAGLQYVDVPGYDALILRKTFPELTQAGGLIPMAHEWLDHTDAVWNEQRHEWRFPSGATLTFGHLQTAGAIRRYFGGERHFVGVDESTGFTWAEIRRLFRVLRRPARVPWLKRSNDGLTSADVPLRLRLASNPGGIGHTWHRRRYVKPATRAEGVVYVPAKIYENPHVDVASYLKMLSHLPPVERQRLIEGDWDVIEAGTIFNRAWLRVEREAPSMSRRVRRWDLAATPEKPPVLEQIEEEMAEESGDDPDYTVGLLYGIDGRREFWVLDVVRGRWHAGDVETQVKSTARHDGHEVHIGISQDPAQAGKSQIRHYARDVLAGYVVKGYLETGSKETRAAIPAAAAANSLVHLLDGPWVDEFLDEVTGFPEGHDDQVDAWSGAHDMLTAFGTAETASPVGRLPVRG